MAKQKDYTLLVLTRALELISRPYGWTKKRSVDRRKGTHLSNSRSLKKQSDSYSYCALGAIGQAKRELYVTHKDKVTYDMGLLGAVTAEHLLARCIAPRSRKNKTDIIVRKNDAPSTKKADMIKAFQCAVDKRKKEVGQ